MRVFGRPNVDVENFGVVFRGEMNGSTKGKKGAPVSSGN